MINLSNFIQAFRKLGSITTRTPPWAVVSFGIMNEKTGAAVIYVDPTTGLPFSGANSLPLLTAQSLLTQTNATASGAIAIQNGTVYITKAGVAAMTLAAPTAAQDGTRIFVTSTTAYAHTITATSLLNNGASGAPYTTVTFAAYPGAGIQLEAVGLLWNVVSNVACTLS